MCRSLIQILKNENMLGYFKCICVDSENVRNKLPPAINKVPTAIIPSIGKKYVADEIFNWVQSLKMVRKQHAQPLQNNISHTSSVCLNNPKTPQSPQTHANPIGFVTHEMSGLSDTYAYTTVDEVPRHSYVSCSEIDKSNIFTAPEKQSKITQSIQPNYIKDIERKRKEQDETIENIFKQQQQNMEYINAKRKETDIVISKIVENQQQKILTNYDNI